MKSFLIVTLTVLYTLGSVASYRTAEAKSDCSPNPAPLVVKMVFAAGWPVSAALVGTMSVLAGDPGIFACRGKYAVPLR